MIVVKFAAIYHNYFSSPDAEDDNEMVFCENCNICVHQACYGILEIPLGDWFCNSCRDLGM